MNDINRAAQVHIEWQLLIDTMLTVSSVHRVQTLLVRSSRLVVPHSAGVYAFWWLGGKERLMHANRHIVLKGPGNRNVDVRYHDWWPADAPYPCLYVGKSTDLRKRFGQHIMNGTRSRLHFPMEGNCKAEPHNSSCQLRFGIEHVFFAEPEPLALIHAEVGFSWCDNFPDNAVAERFFAEDRLVGHLRPWFNIDSER
jgi:hypothetical protein